MQCMLKIIKNKKLAIKSCIKPGAKGKQKGEGIKEVNNANFLVFLWGRSQHDSSLHTGNKRNTHSNRIFLFLFFNVQYQIKARSLYCLNHRERTFVQQREYAQTQQQSIKKRKIKMTEERKIISQTPLCKLINSIFLKRLQRCYLLKYIHSDIIQTDFKNKSGPRHIMQTEHKEVKKIRAKIIKQAKVSHLLICKNYN